MRQEKIQVSGRRPPEGQRRVKRRLRRSLIEMHLNIESLESRRMLAGVRFTPTYLDSAPQAVVSTPIDVNHDGLQDLVHHDAGLNAIVWHLHNPETHEFERQQVVSQQTSNTVAMVVADANSDGLPDLLASTDDGQLQLFLHNGTTLATVPQRLRDDLTPNSRLSAGDVNNDGNDDLLWVDEFKINVLLSDGVGSFDVQIPVVDDVLIGDFELADVDGDERLDVVFLDQRRGTINVAHHRGESFSQPVALMSPAGDTALTRLSVGDLDGDGTKDIVGANRLGDIWAYRNLGDLQSSTPELYHHVESPLYDLAVTDIDQDGKTDLVVRTELSLLWLEGNPHQAIESSTLGDAFRTDDTDEQLFVSDMDSDGLADILLVDSRATLLINGSNYLPTNFIDRGIITHALPLDANSDGIYEVAAAYSVGGVSLIRVSPDNSTDRIPLADIPQVTGLYAADYNQDGHQDVIIATREGIGWFAGHGDFTFDEYQVLIDEPNLESVGIGDIDNDGDQDIFSATRQNSSFVFAGLMYRNEGGQFSSPETLDIQLLINPSFSLIDLNGDGKLDYVAGSAGGTTVLYNRGDGTFQPPIVIANRSTQNLSFGDLDNDGDTDLFVSDLEWFENRQTEAFAARRLEFGDKNPGALGDIDGDVTLDIVSVDHEQLRVWRNVDGQANFVTHDFSIDDAGREVAVYIRDFNGDGTVDQLGVSSHSLVLRELSPINSKGRFETTQSSGFNSTYRTESPIVGDFDADGTSDVILPSEDRVLLFDNSQLNAERPLSQPLTTLDEAFSLRSPQASDIDNDGDLDLITFQNNTIFVNQNQPGEQPFGATESLLVANDIIRRLHIADIDDDNDNDLVVVQSSGTWLYEQVEGQFVAAFEITPNRAYNLVLLDANQDGRIDFAWNDESGKHALLSDGLMTWSDSIVVASDARHIRAVGDTNNDGIDEIVVPDEGVVFTYQFDSSLQRFVERVFEVDDEGDRLTVVDLNGDQRDDILTNNQWFMNLGDRFSAPMRLGTSGRLPIAADFDGDGDLDLAFNSVVNGHLTWLRNESTDEYYVPEYIFETLWIRDSVLADMNDDGLSDLVFISRLGIYWQQQQSDESFTESQRVAVGDDFDQLYVTDVDGDGDLDLIVTPDDESDVVWIENIDRLAATRTHPVFELAEEGSFPVATGDVDGDGDQDLIVHDRDETRIIWFETTAAGSEFSERHVLWDDVPSFVSIHIADVLLGSATPEIFLTSRTDGEIWMLEADEPGVWSAPTRVFSMPDASRATLIVFDASEEPPVDLIVAFGGEGRTLVPQNDGPFQLGELRFTYAADVEDFEAIDLDQNGKDDLLTVGTDQVNLLQQDTTGSFEIVATRPLPNGVRQVSFSNAPAPTLLYSTREEHSVVREPLSEISDQVTEPIGPQLNHLRSIQTADLDQDGRTDLITVANGRLQWRPQRESERFAKPIDIDQEREGYSRVALTDFDGDGDQDVVAQRGLSVWLFENLGQGQFGEATPVREGQVSDFRLYDLDHDGFDEIVNFLYLGGDDDDDEPRDLQILSVSSDGSVSVDTQLSFEHTIIDIKAGPLRENSVSDLVIRFDSRFRDEDEIEVYHQTASMQFERLDQGTPILITHDRDDYKLADLDGDGVAEIVSAQDNQLLAYSGREGQLSALGSIFQTSAGQSTFAFRDIDRDGDVDLIANGTLALNDGMGKFDEIQSAVPLTRFESPHAVADLTFDGIADFLFVYENNLVLNTGRVTTGAGLPSPGDVNQDGTVDQLDLSQMHRSILAASIGETVPPRFDLDLNGKVDSSDGLTLAHGVLSLDVGDINADGLFDSSDLIQLWQAGGDRYEDDTIGNSDWQSGDWNFDGEFDSADLVFALRFGLYQR